MRLTVLLTFVLSIPGCDRKDEAKAATTTAAAGECASDAELVTAKMTALSTCVAAAKAKGKPEGAAEPACVAETEAFGKAEADYRKCIGDIVGGDAITAAIARMKSFTDSMCGCKDNTCAEKVTTEMIKFSEEMQKKYDGKALPEPNEAQKKELEESMKRLTECTTKAMGG